MSSLPADKSTPLSALSRQLRAAYVAELAEELDAIERDLIALEDAARFPEALPRVYRRVRSMKAGAASHGCTALGRICHQLEDHLNSLGIAGPAPRDALDRCLAHVDLMREARDLALRGVEEFQELDGRLETLRRALVGSRFSAMLVETSRVNVKLCSEILSGFPLHLTVLDNGLHALERLLTERYHLLITGSEVKMLNGLALVAAVRLSNRHNQNIKAILLSSQKQRLFRRDTDPDHMIPRDARFPEHLTAAVESCLAQLQAARGG